MVGIGLKYKILLFAALAVSIFCAVGQETDEDHYRLLQRQERQLQLRAESVSTSLTQSKQRYETEPSDSLAERISGFEYQYSVIVERSQAIRMEMSEFDSLRMVAEVRRLTDEVPTANGESVEPAIVLHPEREKFMAILKRYENDERTVYAMAERYKTLHRQANEAIGSYRDATCLTAVDNAVATFDVLADKAKSTADSLADAWDNLSFEKYNAYFDLLDSLKLSDIKSDCTSRSRQTEQTLDVIQGRYADADVAMYPARRRDMVELERRIAANIGLNATADSAAMVASQIIEDEFHLEPLRKPTRADAEFAEVVIDSSARYKSLKDVKAIKVPASGDVYSILLGSFKEQPKLSVFRNAAPLFTERRADGRTYYYAGLYPTEKSATDGFALLLKVGFKNPQVVLWHNALRRDDFAASISATKNATQTKIYKVEINGADSVLPDEVLAIIRRDAPRKEISKIATTDGKFTFTVGAFSQRNEAEELARSILKFLDTKVIEIIL